MWLVVDDDAQPFWFYVEPSVVVNAPGFCWVSEIIEFFGHLPLPRCCNDFATEIFPAGDCSRLLVSRFPLPDPARFADDLLIPARLALVASPADNLTILQRRLP